MISRRTVSVRFLPCALLSILATAAFAATGDPVPGVDISLEQKPGGNIVSTKTAPDGRFQFSGLAPGWYVLRVQRPVPRAAAVSPAPNPGTVHRNYNSIKSNTPGIATSPATNSSYWLAVEGVYTTEARSLQQVISEDRITAGSETEVVVGPEGSLSGRITKEALRPSIRDLRASRIATPGTAFSNPLSPGSAGGTPPAKTVTLRGRIPGFADTGGRPGRVLLVEVGTGRVLAETTLDANGTFNLKTAGKTENKEEPEKEVCVEGNHQKGCFKFEYLPPDPLSCPQLLEEEDPPLCIQVKTK